MQKQVDLTSMKRRLKKQEKVISTRIRVEREKGKIGSIANPDRSDLAHDYSYRARRISLMEQFEDQLDDIKDALQRIEVGTYGKCTNCGNFILPERLDALPHAKLCIDCQRQDIAGN